MRSKTKLHRDMFPHISFFYFKIKKRAVSRPPSKIILCFCLDFHHYYYLKAIKRLIAKLAQKRSQSPPPFLKDFLLKRIDLLYFKFSQKTTLFIKISLKNHHKDNLLQYIFQSTPFYNLLTTLNTSV